MANMLAGIISITISAVILANVFITNVKGTNTSYDCPGGLANATCTWSASEVAMWGLITLVGIVGLVFGVLNIFGLV